MKGSTRNLFYRWGGIICIDFTGIDMSGIADFDRKTDNGTETIDFSKMN